MIERVSFPSPATPDVPAGGVLAVPEGTARAPAVIVVPEWWGINPQIERTVERFAAEGFLALAVDVYRGVSTRDPAEAAKLMVALDGARVLDDVRGALAYLHDHPRGSGKVGIVGFCMGGAYSFAAACFVRGLACAVPFYGLPPRPDWAQVDVPIQAHFASRDDWAKPEIAEQIQQTLAKRGQRMDLHVYDADHAFMNDARPEVYSPDDARVAWERAVDFLRQHLA
jgi:carboxymethylenebutenolidase